jgi:hypothetical protein
VPASLEDIESLFDAVKTLRDERRKMQRLSDKARDADGHKARSKATVDLNWQAFHVNRLEHAAHAAAVNACIADLREPAAYATYSVKLTGWHEYEVVPTKPRDYKP